MAGSITTRLTSRVVAQIRPNGSDFDVRDSELRGFHVRVTRRGGMIYRFQYRRPDGTRPVVTLGRTTELTTDQARRMATDHFRAVGHGGDPRKARQEWAAAPTMDDLWTRYERERLTVRNRPRTIAEYRRNWNTHARPHLGKLKVAEVTRTHVREVINKMGDRRTTANRVLALLSVMFNFAIEHEQRTDNPASNIPKYRENAREIAFTDDELSRIAKAIPGEREPWARVALSLLIVTGARVSEVLKAEWSEFDLDDSEPAWRIPASRMKGGKPHTYPLDPDTVALIRDWRTSAPVVSPVWLFPTSTGTGPKTSLQKPWGRIKTAAKVTRGVLHSFRHTFLTRLAESGASAVDIKTAAGHADVATSMKYVHAAETARLRELQESTRRGLRAAMAKPVKTAEVVPLVAGRD